MAISVLLVDDEPDIREVLNIVLSDSGYTVYTAENGEKALQVFKEVNPAIVLTDIKMPGMDGIELLDRIKREDPEVEVIMITGHGDMELAIQSIQKDASDFITKPINDYALEIALKKSQEKILVRQKLKEYTENLETIALEKARQLSLIEEKEIPTDRLDDQHENLASLGLMVGSISHGLKGLLTGLDGGMYMLNSALEKDNTSEAKEGLAVVKTTTERIRNMVFDLLYYSKKRELKIAPVNVVEFANEVAAIVELKLNWQNIQFVKDFFQAAGQFEVDATAFRSALVNILENAMEACLENKSKSSKISFHVKTTTDFICFEIVDNGIGMDPETVNNIFTLFFSTKGKQGTGLGLYIAEKVIKQHGGGITVDSQKGKGTRFTVKMPRMMLKKEV